MINSHSHIQSLIQLIDDPDELVFNQVRQELLKCGPSAIPFLEQSWEYDIYGLVFQTRIESILQDIHFNETKESIHKWSKSSEKNLIEGALILAKFQYPGLNENLVYDYLSQLKKDIWLELNDELTAFEKVKIFNKVFFELHSFHGDSQNYYSPVNSYINTVIESKKGNPLSLGIIYSHLAQLLDIPIYGVNLPNHFVLAYIDVNHTNYLIEEKSEFGVLFYINVFSKGAILNERDIKEFLAELHIDEKREYFEPCSNTAVLERMIVNLIHSFQQVGNKDKINELKELRAILTHFE